MPSNVHELSELVWAVRVDLQVRGFRKVLAPERSGTRKARHQKALGDFNIAQWILADT